MYREYRSKNRLTGSWLRPCCEDKEDRSDEDDRGHGDPKVVFANLLFLEFLFPCGVEGLDAILHGVVMRRTVA